MSVSCILVLGYGLVDLRDIEIFLCIGARLVFWLTWTFNATNILYYRNSLVYR